MTEWPATKIEMRPIESLIAYARNSRKHSQKQIDQVAASIREFGWTIPVLIAEDNTIIAGHCRVLSAKKLGITEVPTMMAKGWSDAQRRAYVISDNQLTLVSEWDEDLLKVELLDLKNSSFDLALTGFDSAQLDLLLRPETSSLEDDTEVTPSVVDEAQSKWQVKEGQLWQLGQHRLLCGDSTNPDVVKLVMDGNTPLLMVTDPPYGIDYDANWRNEAARDCKLMGNRSIGAGAVGKVMNDHRADWSEAWNLFTGDVAYVWCAPGPLSVTVFNSLNTSGFEVRMQMIWAKNHLVIGRGHYHMMHEPCWYAVRKGATAHWIGDRKQTTLWKIDKPQKSETGHSTQKPIECMAKAIQNHESEFVYEPFSGSGTTIVACEQLQRKCLAVELNPAYVAVTLERYFALTNETPRLL